MTCERYAAVFDLSTENFDDPAAGRAAADAAFMELCRVARGDDRLDSPRRRRRSDSLVQWSFTVEIHSGRAAFELATAVLRTAIHASGGSTAGWEVIRPSVTRSRGRRSRRSRTMAWQAPAPADWTVVSAEARRRGAVPATLPALSPEPMEPVIDLR